MPLAVSSARFETHGPHLVATAVIKFPGRYATTVNFRHPRAKPNDWISVVSSNLIDETDPFVGVYTDLIGLRGGPVNALLPPSATPWIQAFDFVNSLGLGSYAVGSGALPGTLDSGGIDITYETFSADPNLCSACAAGFVDLTVPFTVQVSASILPAPTPEPSSLLLMAMGTAVLIARRVVK